MTIDDKTTQVNSFGKGMNSDLSYLMIGDGLYTFAKNIRITALNLTGQGDITNGQGAVRPIEGVTVHNTGINVLKVLAVNSIRSLGIIVYQDSVSWKVGVFKNKIGTSDTINVTTIYDSGETTDLLKFSTVVHYEAYNLVKLYIADGLNPIKALNIVSGDVEEGEEFGSIEAVDPDTVELYPNIIFKPIKFRGLTTGQLKAGMVAYAYRLYIKHGVSTDMSPVTNLISLVDIETLLGKGQGEDVGAGVILNLTVDSTYRAVFDRILIFRIYYPQNNLSPTITIFIDDDIDKVITDSGLIIDDGGILLSTITTEEFNNMSGLHIIPKILESKNDILFAAATTDSLTSEFEDITDNDIATDNAELDYEFVLMDLIGDASPASGGIIRHNTNQRIANDSSWNLGSGIAGSELERDIKATVKDNNYTYSDPGISYYAKSLRRGETYRYGVVYYNIKGESSGVTHITDVYVGERNGNDHGLSRLKSPFTFDSSSKYELEVHPIGVRFKNIPHPANAVAYEIVRCRRTASDTHNISQGVLSRPVMRYLWSDETARHEASNVYTPTGFITLQDFYFGLGSTSGDELRYMYPADRYHTELDPDNIHADNYDNLKVMQFISPEVCYTPDDFRNLMRGTNKGISTVNILYSNTGQSLRWYNRGVFLTSADIALYPAAIHNANLLLSPRLNGEYKIGVDYSRYPMIFYSAKPGDFYSPRTSNKYDDISYVGRFTYVSPTSNVVSSSQSIALTGDSWNVITKIKPYVYASIKLYNSQRSNQSDNKILKSTIANTIEWNQMFTGDNAEENVVQSYIDAGLSIVDTELFCNAVIGGFYDQRLLGFINTTANAWEGRTDDLLFAATGGRCAVLKLLNNIQIETNDYRQPNYMYTTLCNITQNVTPYGGTSEAAKKLCTYYSHGLYFTEFGSQIVFDGDTYIQPLEYVSMHKQYYAKAFDTVASSMVLYSIPVETSINMTYAHGFEFSKKYRDTEYITNLQVEPVNVYNNLSLTDPLYLYNLAYSTDGSTKPNAPRTDLDDAEMFKTTDYRVYYSNLKINGEYIDSWLHFDTNNFIDVDTKHGPITHMRNFHNKLVFWLEKATGLLSVNERAVLSVMENTAENKASKLPLVLGTGGVLERYDYLDDTTGMAEELYCDTMSSNTLYWYDDNNREIRAYGDGNAIVSLSKLKGVLNILHLYDDANIPWMFYDLKYNEAVLDLLSDHKMSLAYNEQMAAFSSVYDIGFDGAVQFKNGLYLLNISPNGLLIGEWNKSDVPTGFDSKLTSMIQYVVNKAPLITKVFDNQLLISIYDGEHTDDESYFTKDHTYKWKTDLMDTGMINNLKMTLREGNYRYAIPREGNAEYGSRIRGKYMICDIEDVSPKKDASLAFVITKFRTSWI